MILELNSEDDYEILLEYFYDLKKEKEKQRWESLNADEENECYLVEGCIKVLIHELWENKLRFLRNNWNTPKFQNEKKG